MDSTRTHDDMMLIEQVAQRQYATGMFEENHRVAQFVRGEAWLDPKVVSLIGEKMAVQVSLRIAKLIEERMK